MLLFGLLLLCTGTSLASSVLPISIDLGKAEELFERFITDYRRSYKNDEEKLKRFEIFKKNLLDINERNKNFKRIIYGITKFIDLLPEELKRYHGCVGSVKIEGCIRKEFLGSVGGAPESFDWREKGVVTEVKNQKKCGSCWAYSTTGNVEGQYAKKYGQLVELSEQQLVECDRSNNGCDGGHMGKALLYYKKNGAQLEKDYPTYSEVDPKACQYNRDLVKVNVTDCIDFTGITEEELKEVLYEYGPISLALCASDWDFFSLGDVVLPSCDCKKINHGVLLVGYGTDEEGVPYWIVKNSWGLSFADDGYIKIKRGVNSCNMMNGMLFTSNVA